MKLISCHNGKLHTLDAKPSQAGSSLRLENAFRTGLSAFDALPPGGALARGAVHELLTEAQNPKPFLLAAWLARCSWGTEKSGSLLWSDPKGELYPPAVAALGIPLDRLLLIHPTNESDQIWAIAECLRCPGVGAVVATLPERRARGKAFLSRVEARRLQLAAEQGGGIGLLLRTAGKHSAEHAAVTRWLVQPAQGEKHVQRWRIQLLFGHGGQVGQSIILEHHRDPGSTVPRFAAYPLHPPAQLANRPPVPASG